MPAVDLSQSAAKARRSPDPSAEGEGAGGPLNDYDPKPAALVDDDPDPEADAPSEVINVMTAFMIVILEDGQVGLIADINSPVVSRREASGDEIYGALAATMHKLSSASIASQAAVMAANEVVSQMQNAGRKMMEAQQTAQIKAKLQWEHDHPGKVYPGTSMPPGAVPSGFRKPGR